jgi:hypothetical protein
MRYRKKPVEVDATRWWRNGDHPDDGTADSEGAVVRYYRTPPRDDAGDVDPNGWLEGPRPHYDLPDTRRPNCTAIMNDHGWIDIPGGGHTVCPGDFIITGVAGERYPCEPSIFAVTYEPVDNPLANLPAPRWDGIERGAGNGSEFDRRAAGARPDPQDVRQVETVAHTIACYSYPDNEPFPYSDLARAVLAALAEAGDSRE